MSAPDRDTDRRAEMIRAWRDLSDFFEQHPAVPVPYCEQVDVFADDLAAVRAATHLSGQWDKGYYGSYVAYVKQFGPLALHMNVAREKVCRRVQTGTKHVEAVEAHDEPVFEWICDEPPVADAGQVEAAELTGAGGSA